MLSEMIVISDTPVTVATLKPSKPDALLKLVKSADPSCRFLVFSEYDNSFLQIQDTFARNDVAFKVLKGTTLHLQRILAEFQTGDTSVLLLNANNLGTGINLQCTTDVVFYHKMDDDISQQIVGRGQRHGRTSQLRVHHLRYDIE